ncbi:MAG TPA: hypothetical protein VFF18_07010 [Woeseiaceae bacterium]|nr:hypothetical protein [Woeseiaceae bacterium]
MRRLVAITGLLCIILAGIESSADIAPPGAPGAGGCDYQRYVHADGSADDVATAVAGEATASAEDLCPCGAQVAASPALDLVGLSGVPEFSPPRIEDSPHSLQYAPPLRPPRG